MTPKKLSEQQCASLPRSILDAALAYALRGWYVFPAPPGQKKSHKSAKHSGGRKWGKTTAPDEIRTDFKRWPNANVGLPTGKDSGFWVMEADTLEGHDKDGFASVRQLEEAHDPLPLTLMAQSPTGSKHWYFNWPEGTLIMNSAGKIAPGIDIRGEGGMVIAPPSVTAKGTYKWLNDAPVVDAPGWLINLTTAGKPTDNIVDFPAPSKERLEKEAQYAGKGVSTDPDDLLPKASIDDIKAALAVIPANCGEDVWWRICAALYDHFGGTEEGFKIFHDWSKTGGDKYKGERDCRNKWEHSATKKDIHIATVFHYADQNDASWRDNIEGAPEPEAEDEEPPTKSPIPLFWPGEEAAEEAR